MYKTIIKKSLKYIFIFIGFFSLYFFYYLSLEKCNLGIDKCSSKVKWIKFKIEEEIISCVLAEIMLQLMIFKIISLQHLIHFLVILMFFFSYSNGVNFDDHGYYNFFYYYVLLLIFTILLLPFDCLVLNSKTKKIRLKLIFIYIFVILFIFIFLSSIGNNCNNWDKGLNNTIIYNNKTKFGCTIQIPQMCIYKYLKTIQDYTKLFGKNCTNYKDGKEQKEKLIKFSKSPFINKTVKRIGYPLLNKESECLIDSKDHSKFYRYFLRHLVDLDNEKILNEYFENKKPEIEVDFNNIKEPKLVINLHFNKTLSKERKLLEKNSNPFSDNVLILYLDSLSRANAMRQLKKTTKFFEKFMSYEGGHHYKYPSNNYHSFQFFKYYSFKGHTAINYPLLFYGQYREKKNKSLITKFYKQNGFITSECIDYCGFDNIRTYHNYTNEDIYDHVFALCDPNNDHFNLNTVRCLYGKVNSEYLLEYTEQFWRKYINNRKYSIIINNHAHEGTLNAVKYIDDLISNFLLKLFNNNLLKDTTVLLLSDHGVGMPSIYYSSDFYNIEIQLPILLIMMNDRKNLTYEEQYKYIYENQQIFVTPFDVYNFLGNIVYGNKYSMIDNITKNIDTCKSSNGISLLEQINPKERKPQKYKYLSHISMSDLSCK